MRGGPSGPPFAFAAPSSFASGSSALPLAERPRDEKPKADDKPKSADKPKSGAKSKPDDNPASGIEF